MSRADPLAGGEPERRRRHISIRLSLARNLMLMIFVTAGAILAVSYFWSRHVVAELSEELITQQIDQTEQALQKFFLPVENALLLLRAWGSAEILEAVDVDAIEPSRAGGRPADAASPVGPDLHAPPDPVHDPHGGQPEGQLLPGVPAHHALHQQRPLQGHYVRQHQAHRTASH